MMIMTRNFVCRVLRVWDRLALPSRADGGGAGPYVRHGCLRNDLSANTWPLQRDRQAGVKTAFIGASFSREKRPPATTGSECTWKRRLKGRACFSQGKPARNCTADYQNMLGNMTVVKEHPATWGYYICARVLARSELDRCVSTLMLMLLGLILILSSGLSLLRSLQCTARTAATCCRLTANLR